jgi:hypothetical protein
MGGSSKPKQPKPTPQQVAFERSQAMALSKEVEQENRRRKALIRGQLGTTSLLGMGGKIEAPAELPSTPPPPTSTPPRRKPSNRDPGGNR